MAISRKVFLRICQSMQKCVREPWECLQKWEKQGLPCQFFFKINLASFFSSQKFNHGRYLSMTAVKGQRRSVNIVPENTFNAGSKDVTTNMAGFTSKRIAITNGKQNATTEGTYIEAFARSKWQINDKIQVIQSTGKAIKVEGTTYPLKSDLQRRCIVGRKIHQQIWKPNS